jgi:hypothetical protein
VSTNCCTSAEQGGCLCDGARILFWCKANQRCGVEIVGQAKGSMVPMKMKTRQDKTYIRAHMGWVVPKAYGNILETFERLLFLFNN